MKDPQEIWQNQPTEPLRMSATDLRRKALETQSRVRFAAVFSIIMGIIFCVFFAWWSFARAHEMLARMGFALGSLCMIYLAYHGYKTWPGSLPEEGPINTCLEFYRRALERERDYNHRFWRSGLPVLTLLAVVMAAVGTGARNAPPHPLLNALPFFLALALWAVIFFFLRKKLGRKNLQREIEELRAFERENR
jgi:hypothetical protein